MGIHLADQTQSFLFACLLGAALGVLYDGFRILRIAIPTGKAVVFIEDVLFFLICAAASFLFLLSSSDGVVRVFLLIGEALGAILYRYTLGVLVMGVAGAIIDGVRAVFRFLVRFLLLPLWRFLYGVIALLLRPFRFLGQIMKKMLRRLKFRLKVGRVVLYNQLTGSLRRMAAGRRKKADVHRETGTYGEETGEEEGRA